MDRSKVWIHGCGEVHPCGACSSLCIECMNRMDCGDVDGICFLPTPSAYCCLESVLSCRGYLISQHIQNIFVSNLSTLFFFERVTPRPADLPVPALTPTHLFD